MRLIVIHLILVILAKPLQKSYDADQLEEDIEDVMDKVRAAKIHMLKINHVSVKNLTKRLLQSGVSKNKVVHLLGYIGANDLKTAEDDAEIFEELAQTLKTTSFSKLQEDFKDIIKNIFG